LKFVPNAITSAYNAISKLNTNFTNLANLIENCLFRDGTSPNGMLAPLDMNGFKVENVGEPVNDSDAARLQDLRDVVINSTTNPGFPIILGQYYTVAGKNLATLNKATIAAGANLDIPISGSALVTITRYSGGTALVLYESFNDPVIVAQTQAGAFVVGAAGGGVLGLTENGNNLRVSVAVGDSPNTIEYSILKARNL
jgi:hypothetical protein